MKKVEAEQRDKNKLAEFKSEVKKLCQNAPQNYCAPLLMRDINGLYRKMFGKDLDYSREKALFNSKLLSLEERIFDSVKADKNPLKRALKFAIAANYIDFARLSDLDESAVSYVLDAAEKAEPQEIAFEKLKNLLQNAKTLCYLHDNCGEIVLDKIFIRTVKALYPEIKVYSVVRGLPIINDVTREDAAFVHLDGYAEIVDNGTGIPGTYLKEVSPRVKRLLSSCDVTISKGLGNLETLYGEGYPVFYCFMCKCEHIARRFNSPLWSAVFTEENV